MKHISWKRWMAALGALALCCVLFLLTEYLVFFIAGLVAFFTILVAAFIG